MVTMDKAFYSPGQMGWGTKDKTPEELHTAEKKELEVLHKKHPSQLIRSPAKSVVNQWLLNKIEEMQKQDGIEEGFNFLYLERAVFGMAIPWHAQIIGSCVASGGRIVDSGRMLAECFLFNEPEELFGSEYVGPDNVSPFAPYSYRAGRHFAGIGGNSDGSLCRPHIRGKMEYGLLPCSAKGLAYSGNDLPEPQSSSEYRKWGANNRLLDEFRSQAIYKLTESEAVTDAEQAKELLIVHKKPMQICSMWAFQAAKELTGLTYDGKTVWLYRRNPRDRWAHNMSVYGCFLFKGQWYVLIRNTWADAHKNGDFFVITLEEFGRWLPDSETQTIGGIDMPDTIGPTPE